MTTDLLSDEELAEWLRGKARRSIPNSKTERLLISAALRIEELARAEPLYEGPANGFARAWPTLNFDVVVYPVVGANAVEYG
jgi:hypothetical protein